MQFRARVSWSFGQGSQRDFAMGDLETIADFLCRLLSPFMAEGVEELGIGSGFDVRYW
jgi:hypothetical protein